MTTRTRIINQHRALKQRIEKLSEGSGPFTQLQHAIDMASAEARDVMREAWRKVDAKSNPNEKTMCRNEGSGEK